MRNTISTLSDIYNHELIRDVTTCVFSEFGTRTIEDNPCAAQVRKDVLALSKQFPFRRPALLRTLHRANSVEEVGQTITVELETYGRREAVDASMPANAVLAGEW
jgi:hypothetical protein